MNNLFTLIINNSPEDSIIIGIQTSLLSKNFNINERNEDGNTLLSLSLLMDKLKVAEYLLNEVEGIDFSYGKNTQNTCLTIISVKKLYNLVKDKKPVPQVSVKPIEIEKPITYEPVSEKVVIERINMKVPATPKTDSKPINKPIQPVTIPEKPIVREEKPKRQMGDSDLKRMADELNNKTKKPVDPKNNVVAKSKTTIDKLKERIVKGKNIWKRINGDDR